MRIGDLVKYHWPHWLGPMDPSFDKGFGVVVSIESWIDKGAPDRNFGVTVSVLWHDGKIENYEADELTFLSEAINEDDS